MRVVLDTNILISAVWKPGGNEDHVVQLVLSGALTAVATPALLAEYHEVLRRPKFQRHTARIEHLLARFEAALLPVESKTALNLASDPDDNLVLEAALAGQAAYLITGNLRDYPADWPVARITNARQFLDQTGL